MGGSDAGASDLGRDDSGSGSASIDSGAMGTSTAWDPVTYLKADRHSRESFGTSIDADGDVLVVGATHYDGRGAAFVFVRDGDAWRPAAILRASNADVGDAFGWDVAVSGDRIAVAAAGEASATRGVNGDPSDESNEEGGAVYVFARAGDEWTQEAYLKASGPAIGEAFGYAIALDGATLVASAIDDASASGDDRSDQSLPVAGAVYVFTRSAGAWSEQAYLKASNVDDHDAFGHSVAVSGDTISIGAIHESSAATGIDGDGADDSAPSSGAVYVFQRSGTTWTQGAYVKAANSEAGDSFGYRLALSRDTLVVTAPGEDSAPTPGSESNEVVDSGAFYVFERSRGTWTQTAMLKASSAREEDYLGSGAVDVQGDALVVSTYLESGVPTGGAAFAFERGSDGWVQRAHLKAPNAEADDQFGASAAVAEGFVAVSAAAEASSATGVNGDGDDNTAELSGAVYVFPWDTIAP